MKFKLLQFSGPCSFATFLAAAGEPVLPAVKCVHCFEQGHLFCLLETDSLDEYLRQSTTAALRAAHAVEPLLLEHDVTMTPTVTAFIIDHVGKTITR